MYLICTEKCECGISRLLSTNYMEIGDYDFELSLNTQKELTEIIYDMKTIINNRAKVNNSINTNVNTVILKSK